MPHSLGPMKQQQGCFHHDIYRKTNNVFIQALQRVFIICFFLMGSFSIVIFQVCLQLILPWSKIRLHNGMNQSKKAFIVLLCLILNMVAPSSLNVTFEASKSSKSSSGTNSSFKFKDRAVIMANHQMYADWIYLWWLSSISNLGGNVFIILKKALKYVPLLGFGMQNFKFIFLSRNWRKDETTLTNNLVSMDLNARCKGPLTNYKTCYSKTNESVAAYNLIMFPEGTNLSPKTKKKSEAYCQRAGLQDVQLRHLLLPHSKGLKFALEKLALSLDAVYDVTIGYSPALRTEYVGTKFTLKKIFLMGVYPERIDFHIREFKVDEIPLQDDEVFFNWLLGVWKEKDQLLENYYNTGQFRSDDENRNRSVVITKQTDGFQHDASAPRILSYYGILAFLVLLFTMKKISEFTLP
ncbi:putative acyltransferase SKDI_04G2510 [Saccharomyces kudriavzevii IFO 1802]|uniref:YDR018C-like protein n=2 Tax=Saccharomyces kudriavzevii (strain ATCC MYA-4449 / AS 2.2408 / CBS 8840 / NBRC 1802 / NCYC 2889) TaxID=226230 RepID=J5PMD5_SACK1|nr:uncharacterized protein SKDI_04G2510 [Saccharomyces kudriavzevii IFO 1802]EJT43068.1 YDR018C-like protein [Saccharomyces kudriavzevii IFO 1802]CAI4057881.1 hypothetical protein SKDI_04G2510 [Saccharomyces kudriavzevii IFO 1802]